MMVPYAASLVRMMAYVSSLLATIVICGSLKMGRNETSVANMERRFPVWHCPVMDVTLFLAT